VTRARRRAGALALLALGLAAAASGGFSGAVFSAASASPANNFSAAADWTPPDVPVASIARQGATAGGAIAPGGSYYVYAVVVDTGAPAAGVAAVAADVSALTSGAASVPLAAGSWTLGGTTYNRRSALLTADAGLGAGPAALSITATDAAGNRAAHPFTVSVDTTPPTATDVQAANGGAASGLLEAGDALTLTFSEPIDPGTIVAGWDGVTPTPVVVRVARSSTGGNNQLTILDAGGATALPLGSVDLGRNDFVTTTASFGASGTPSTLAHALVTQGTTPVSRLTITLGTASAGTRRARGAGTLVWQPAAGVLDPAGNAMSTAAASEQGAVDVDF
jgi:hypothetical protein